MTPEISMMPFQSQPPRHKVAIALDFLLQGHFLLLGGSTFTYSEDKGLCIVLSQTTEDDANVKPDKDAVQFLPTNIPLIEFVNNLGQLITDQLVVIMEEIIWKQHLQTWRPS